MNTVETILIIASASIFTFLIVVASVAHIVWFVEWLDGWGIQPFQSFYRERIANAAKTIRRIW